MTCDEEADAKDKEGESWKLVNKIIVSKKSKQKIIKGNSREKETRSLYAHFQNLLSKE